MSWQSFALTRADEATRRGFKLIGRQVLQRRHRMGLSQRELERLCGVDQTVISRLENGQLASLRWSTCARLVSALHGLGETDVAPSSMTRTLPSRGDDGH